MPKRRTNKLRWQGKLMTIDSEKDVNDRPKVIYNEKRTIFYNDIGITANEKFLSKQYRENSKQEKTEVVRRIVIRLDMSITEKYNAIKIGDVLYNIARIYTNMDDREMELSLSYVD